MAIWLIFSRAASNSPAWLYGDLAHLLARGVELAGLAGIDAELGHRIQAIGPVGLAPVGVGPIHRFEVVRDRLHVRREVLVEVRLDFRLAVLPLAIGVGVGPGETAVAHRDAVQ
ncbi:MAG: hypothetical protein MUE63_09545, partial [Xanthomonadales bacterium]|nr:hypothetical protein [Xanthomonadales bacterium]